VQTAREQHQLLLRAAETKLADHQAHTLGRCVRPTPGAHRVDAVSADHKTGRYIK
jgi:hypothetical protein